MCDRAIVLLILGTHAAEHCVAPVTLNISDDSVSSSVALTREPPAPAFRFRQRKPFSQRCIAVIMRSCEETLCDAWQRRVLLLRENETIVRHSEIHRRKALKVTW